jgi:hypothetical protein
MQGPEQGLSTTVKETSRCAFALNTISVRGIEGSSIHTPRIMGPKRPGWDKCRVGGEWTSCHCLSSYGPADEDLTSNQNLRILLQSKSLEIWPCLRRGVRSHYMLYLAAGTGPSRPSCHAY